MDLYRLSGEAEDLRPLNLEQVFQRCISLIEWPERLASVQVPIQDLLKVDIRITALEEADDVSDNTDGELGDDCSARLLTFSCPEASRWEERLHNIKQEGYLDDMLSTSEVKDRR